MDQATNLLAQTVPGLTISFGQLIVTVVGIMGALTLMYGVLLEEERRQDAVFVVAAASLLVYALVRRDYVFTFAMAGMLVVAGRELIQIFRGKHHHTTSDMQKYEHLR